MELRLDFEQQIVDGRACRRVFLSIQGLPDLFAREGVFFAFDESERVPEPLVLDGFMFGFLHLAMERAKRFVISGPISSRALRNARIYQEAWHKWLPDQYRPVEIVAEKIVSDWRFALRRRERTIGAFSVGIDATFTALRHGGRRLGNASFPLTAALTVHGFDVAIENESGFSQLLQRTRPLLKSLNLKQRTIKTDIKSPYKYIQNWEHSFGAQAACALHQFSHEFDYALFGSSEPYNHMMNAWGSTPSTDYLLSGGDMEIVHEGAGYSRTDKTALIAEDPIARKTVKVCWEGEDQHRNCGVCEKCIRTRLNFLAVGDADPPCFDTPFDMSMIDRLKVRKIVQLTELVTILEYAGYAEIGDEWVHAPRRKVDEERAALAMAE